MKDVSMFGYAFTLFGPVVIGLFVNFIILGSLVANLREKPTSSEAKGVVVTYSLIAGVCAGLAAVVAFVATMHFIAHEEIGFNAVYLGLPVLLISTMTNIGKLSS